MDNENGNQAAYPESIATNTHGDIEHSWSVGLTKREHFAAMAMQGFMSNSTFMHALAKAENADPEKISETLASGAVEHADALLAALAKEQ